MPTIIAEPVIQIRKPRHCDKAMITTYIRTSVGLKKVGYYCPVCEDILRANTP